MMVKKIIFTLYLFHAGTEAFGCLHVLYSYQRTLLLLSVTKFATGQQLTFALNGITRST